MPVVWLKTPVVNRIKLNYTNPSTRAIAPLLTIEPVESSPHGTSLRCVLRLLFPVCPRETPL
ncbi:hypothetical protein [uncultured Thermosynechococcus sp.]|uniref:hypothetical protein n=1 Tax=uncultured Thermosynechococcus sp. TaxID=436945 RepID=UPI00261BFED8|nr:hypothetical protein [uncultured Thermosynechococcus sp.]